MVQRPLALVLAASILAALPLLVAQRSGLPGDCDGNGQVSIGEVQKAINMFLGIENWGQVLPLTPASPLPPAPMQALTPTHAPACGVDANGDGSVSIGEVQKVINAFLGLIPLYTIRASAGRGGAIEPSGDILAAQGSSQAFAVTPDLGMAIEDVFVDGASVGPLPSYSFENILADHSIAASFTPLCASPQITKPPQSQEVAHGATATLTVEASGTMPLSYLWYQGESGDEGHPIPDAIQPSYTIPPLTETSKCWVKVSNACGHADSPTAVITVAPVPAHLLTVTLGEGVTGAPAASGAYEEGAVVAYAYEARTCYGNLTVTLDGSPAGASGTVTMDAPHELNATAAPLTHTIEATSGPGGTISPTGSVPVACGANQAFAIASGVGYQLLDVLVDGTSAGKVQSYTFTDVTANHTIAASFVATLRVTCSAATP